MNWQTIKLIGISILAVACIAFFGLWRYCSLELDTAQTALKTANDIISKYENNNAITEEVGNEYQKTIDKLNADIKRLRSYNARCYPITITSGGANATTAGRELPVRDGIDSRWLYDFAGRCEGERLKVIGLQKFIDRIYENRNERP